MSRTLEPPQVTAEAGAQDSGAGTVQPKARGTSNLLAPAAAQAAFPGVGVTSQTPKNPNPLSWAGQRARAWEGSLGAVQGVLDVPHSSVRAWG